MQYQVPQFIETEDKIIGGVLTLKQFLIIAAAGGLSFIFYFIFGSLAWFILTVFVGAIAVGVAFIKIQGRSVPTMVTAALAYYWSPRFYLWKSQAEATAQIFSKNAHSAGSVTEEKEFAFHKKAQEDILTFPKASHPEKSPAVPLEHAWKLTEKIIASPHEKSDNISVGREVWQAGDKQGTTTGGFLKELSPEPEKVSPIDLELLAQKKKERESLHDPRSLEPAGPEKIARATGESMKEIPLMIREKLAISRKVQDLLQKIMTSKDSIPKREKRIFGVEKNPREHYELLRRATGEVEAARRVDYSDLRHK